MDAPSTATCSCGALRATVTAAPVTTAICSCTECQRRTGSAFGWSGYWEDRDVTIEGASTTYSRTSNLDRRLDFRFCPACGSTLWWTAEFMPGRIGIALGNFADTSLHAPKVAVWDKRRAPWIGAEGLTCYPEGRF